MDILDLNITEGIDFYIEGLKMRDEERLYKLWAMLKSSFGGNEVPAYSKFSENIFSSHKEIERTEKQKAKERNRREARGLGKIKGQDLVKM